MASFFSQLWLVSLGSHYTDRFCLPNKNLPNVTQILGKRLDFDTAPTTYTFEVSVFDSIRDAAISRSSVVNVTVNLMDVNDNRPLFSPATYVASVIDDVSSGTQIKTLSATDADSGNNAVITMRVTGGDPGQQFFMDGNILTLSRSLDADTVDSYKLVVEAKDNAATGYELSSTALVSVYVSERNNMLPAIVQQDYTSLSFPEDTAIGTLLFQIQAHDDDSSATILTFAISDVTSGRNSPPTPQYEIDSSNGNVYLGAEFDYEDGKADIITVIVSDGTNSQAVRIIVNVTDVNEHAPTCSFSLGSVGFNENTGKTVVRYLEASNLVYDLDYQAKGVTNAMKYTLLYASAQDVFALDPFTGATGSTSFTGRLELIDPVVDYESDITDYHLIFSVSDQDYNPVALTSTCNIRIRVQDVNDNAPEFLPESLFIEAMEQTSFSHLLDVTDADSLALGGSIAACTTNSSSFSVVLASKTLRFDLSSTLFTREDLGITDTSL